MEQGGLEDWSLFSSSCRSLPLTVSPGQQHMRETYFHGVERTLHQTLQEEGTFKAILCFTIKPYLGVRAAERYRARKVKQIHVHVRLFSTKRNKPPAVRIFSDSSSFFIFLKILANILKTYKMTSVYHGS